MSLKLLDVTKYLVLKMDKVWNLIHTLLDGLNNINYIEY
jgi:hypothetical protein